MNLTLVRTQVSPFLISLTRVSGRSDPINQARVYRPASKEMISDSVELCETEVCFLHIRLIGTDV